MQRVVGTLAVLGWMVMGGSSVQADHQNSRPVNGRSAADVFQSAHWDLGNAPIQLAGNCGRGYYGGYGGYSAYRPPRHYYHSPNLYRSYAPVPYRSYYPGSYYGSRYGGYPGGYYYGGNRGGATIYFRF